MNNPLNQEDISRYNYLFWKLILVMIAMSVLLFVATGFGLFGDLPSFRDLENPKSNLASEIISSDHVVLGTYYIQNRSSIRYEEISDHVINALIATEDIRFYSHSGIDFKRTFSIIFYNLVGNKQGASTITQQLALNLFSREGRSNNYLWRFVQKLQELIIAIRLERNYTKEEIITMYLNTVDFGSYNTYGIKSAARTYFNTTPNNLSAEQAAALIGTLKGPSYYSLTRHPERSKIRRNIVLNNMERAGYLGMTEAEFFKKKPLGLIFKVSDHNEGSAVYFRAALRKEIKDILRRTTLTKLDGSPYDLDRDGLKIYTTINSRMQRYAEEVQRRHLKSLQASFNMEWRGKNPFQEFEQQLMDAGIKRSDRYLQLIAEGKTEHQIKRNFNTRTKMTIFSWRGTIDTMMKPIDSVRYYKLMLRNAIMSMEPQTGYVRAWVGGANYEYFKYDQVKQGTRQVGSTAKPFTYAVALQNGFSPCFKVANDSITIDGWTPKTPHPTPGYLTLKQALAQSQNYIAAYLIGEVGASAVAALIKKMGITGAVPAYPSICLGTFNASLYDMVGAYSAFVNHGIWTQPIYLLSIQDANGNVLYENKPKIVVALEEQYAYVMTNMLKEVVSDGTGIRLRNVYNLMNPIGGKTGTTQNNSDGWFIGITPELVTGVWTGCEDRAVHFISNQGEGSNVSLPIFGLFMQKVYADSSLKYSKDDFELPKNGIDITLDCDTYNMQRDSTLVE